MRITIKSDNEGLEELKKKLHWIASEAKIDVRALASYYLESYFVEQGLLAEEDRSVNLDPKTVALVQKLHKEEPPSNRFSMIIGPDGTYMDAIQKHLRKAQEHTEAARQLVAGLDRNVKIKHSDLISQLVD